MEVPPTVMPNFNLPFEVKYVLIFFGLRVVVMIGFKCAGFRIISKCSCLLLAAYMRKIALYSINCSYPGIHFDFLLDAKAGIIFRSHQSNLHLPQKELRGNVLFKK